MQTQENEITKEGWDADELAEQSSGKDADEIRREILRGGKNTEDADERDNAGSVDSSETPHGRDEAKNDSGGKTENNDR